jgi:hypothetical protein
LDRRSSASSVASTRRSGSRSTPELPRAVARPGLEPELAAPGEHHVLSSSPMKLVVDERETDARGQIIHSDNHATCSSSSLDRGAERVDRDRVICR